jgi:hypothetical protein
VFLSHDVDWRREGPEIEHIRARKDRFEKRIIDNLETKNPYYNTPEIMDLEDKFGVKSTFFYRTKYENGNFKNYENDIVSLLKGMISYHYLKEDGKSDSTVILHLLMILKN